jgi:hypothetical protein
MREEERLERCLHQQHKITRDMLANCKKSASAKAPRRKLTQLVLLPVEVTAR